MHNARQQIDSRKKYKLGAVKLTNIVPDNSESPLMSPSVITFPAINSNLH